MQPETHITSTPGETKFSYIIIKKSGPLLKFLCRRDFSLLFALKKWPL